MCSELKAWEVGYLLQDGNRVNNPKHQAKKTQQPREVQASELQREEWMGEHVVLTRRDPIGSRV